MFKSLLAVSAGATFGALLRWVLSLRLNAVFLPLPLGTFAANLIGAYIAGVALGFFIQMPAIASEWRLFIMTGFCGSLTTFSTFSTEVANQLQQERYLWALGVIGAHVGGSLFFTFLGLLTASWIAIR